MNSASVMDPETVLSSEQTLQKIDTLCKRHFSDENERNECYLFIIDSLKASDYSRLRTYRGKSSLSTYIYALVNSLIGDFRRRRYGRRRIPKAVSALGQWAEAVYRFVCWQKFSFDDAYDLLVVKGFFEDTFEKYLSRLAPIRTALCPEDPSFESADSPEARAYNTQPNPDPGPLDTLIEKLDHQKRIKAIGIIRRITEELSDKDRLLVRLVFGSDRSASAAARVIGGVIHGSKPPVEKTFIKIS